MWSRSPVEWGRILNGQVNGDGASCRIYHSTPDDYQRWAEIFARSPTASQILPLSESVLDFYSMETDLARLIPKEQHAEALFSMKMGFNVPSVPMQFIYFATKLFSMYEICNLVGPMFPRELAFYMDKPGYFAGGYTPMDVLRTYVHEDFAVVTEESPLVRCGDWYEAYLPSEDMVCALPLSVGEKLSKDDCARITHVPGRGLTINQVPLATLGGLKGVSESVYDLRRAI